MILSYITEDITIHIYINVINYNNKEQKRICFGYCFCIFVFVDIINHISYRNQLIFGYRMPLLY